VLPISYRNLATFRPISEGGQQCDDCTASDRLYDEAQENLGSIPKPIRAQLQGLAPDLPEELFDVMLTDKPPTWWAVRHSFAVERHLEGGKLFDDILIEPHQRVERHLKTTVLEAAGYLLLDTAEEALALRLWALPALSTFLEKHHSCRGDLNSSCECQGFRQR
tara:strand:+ start:280 stop:771 length:492 start_codon:yes stop_codon:yes gene_type:complete